MGNDENDSDDLGIRSRHGGATVFHVVGDGAGDPTIIGMLRGDEVSRMRRSQG
jgi:hypothetical protein